MEDAVSGIGVGRALLGVRSIAWKYYSWSVLRGRAGLWSVCWVWQVLFYGMCWVCWFDGCWSVGVCCVVPLTCWVAGVAVWSVVRVGLIVLL